MDDIVESPEREIIIEGAEKAGFPTADALTMVAIFALLRVERRGSSPRDSVKLGGKVLCFIFDPVKSRDVAFTRAMHTLRESFRDIAYSEAGRAEFAEAITKEFLMIDSLEDALKLGAPALLRPEYQAGAT